MRPVELSVDLPKSSSQSLSIAGEREPRNLKVSAMLGDNHTEERPSPTLFPSFHDIRNDSAFKNFWTITIWMCARTRSSKRMMVPSYSSEPMIGSLSGVADETRQRLSTPVRRVYPWEPSF